MISCIQNSRKFHFLGMESRTVIARGWNRWGRGGRKELHRRKLLGWWKCIFSWLWSWFQACINMSKHTTLYTSSMCQFLYVNYTSIKLLKVDYFCNTINFLKGRKMRLKTLYILHTYFCAYCVALFNYSYAIYYYYANLYLLN